MPGYNLPDVLVVGCGAGGAVVAKECAEAGMGVVVLEAGVWHDPQRDFNGLEWDMTNQIDSVFRWGPPDRTRPPWPRSSDGISPEPQVAGVGGNTLHFGGNCPRAYPAAVELEWPLSYGELVGYYERVEAALPVVVPETLSAKDDRFLAGCAGIGLEHLTTSDVLSAGWRIQPNAILPVERSRHTTFPRASGCIECGECVTGCRHPTGAPLASTAKRGTHVSYAPAALRTGRCEIRTGCFATRLLTEMRGGELCVRAVRYRDPTGRVFEQDAQTVVLAGGAVESPRLWMASGLPSAGAVGRNLTTHWLEYVAGTFDRAIEPFQGQTSMTRADFPGFGSIETMGGGPMRLGSLAFLGEWSRGAGGGVWASRGRLLGEPLKRRMEAYRRTLVLVCSVDDEVSQESAVTLDPSLGDEHNPAPRVRYRPTPTTVARRDWLATKAAEILIAAGARPSTIHRADARPSLVNQHGTMRMGRDPRVSVVDDACESHMVKRLFVADASALPNGLGGASPALTIQALATRTAAKIAERYVDV